MSKPLMIWQGGISGTWYATRTYQERPNGGFVCTGAKEDVTEQVNAIRRAVIEELAKEAEAPRVLTRDMISRGQGWKVTADWLRSKLTEGKP